MTNDVVKAWLDAKLDVTDDSRALVSGGVLVWDSRIAPALTEKVFADARAKGASAIFSNATGEGVTTVEQPGALLAAYAKAKWPKQPPVIVGVTGTSGKTSVAWFAQQLAAGMGKKGASIGTLGVVRNNAVTDYTGYTSPTALQLHPRLDALAREGVTHVAMEVSSHALDFFRADGVDFAAAGFTNLSQDHLDYHGTKDAYMAAKARFFAEVLPERRTGVINMMRPELWSVASLLKQRGCGVLTVGTGNAELVVEVLEILPDGLRVSLKYDREPFEFVVPLVGSFQAENLAMALGLWVAAGVPWKDLMGAVKHITSVPGRMEIVPGKTDQPVVVVDYAHKPDALEKAIAALRPQVKEGGKLWVVFGCGGNRDATKRPLMGEIAGRLADCVVVTDDNPRKEVAAEIREQVVAGVGDVKELLWNIGDRREAIKCTLAEAKAGDMVLVAGKGHEEGQIVGDTVLPFDDRLVVKELLG